MSESSQPILTPEFALIRGGQRSVDTYRQCLFSLYTRPKMQHLMFNHWEMTELRTYKDKKTKVKHEYLIATFTDGGEGKVHLRMERRIQDSSVKKIVTSITKRSNPPSDSEGGARPDDHASALIKKWANDDVILYPDDQLVQDEKDDKLPVDHISFPKDDRVNLPQLILLACAINEYSTTYHLTQNNCYWFCYTAAEALKARLPHFNSLPVRGKGQQGTWLGLPTGMLSKAVNIPELLVKTDAMYEEFKKEVDATINNPDNKHTKEARKLAAKEGKRAEEEKKRADEEKKRAEGEKKRAEEEKKRAEEEKKRAEEEKKRAEEAEGRVEEEKKRAEKAERRIVELEAKFAAQAKVST